SVPIIYWFVASFAMAGLRLARKGARRKLQKQYQTREEESPRLNRDRKRALLIGDIDWAESILEPFDRLHGNSYGTTGLLAHCGLDLHLKVRGIRVLGTVESLEEIVSQLARHDRRPQAL